MKRNRARRFCAVAGVTCLLLGSALVLLNLQIGLAIIGAGLAGLAGAALLAQRQLLAEAATARRGAQVRHAKEREQFAQLDNRLSNFKPKDTTEATAKKESKSNTQTYAPAMVASPTQLPPRARRKPLDSSFGSSASTATLQAIQIYRSDFGRPGVNMQLYVRVLDEHVYDGEYQASLTLQPHMPPNADAPAHGHPGRITTNIRIPQSEPNVAIQIDSGILASSPIEKLELKIIAVRPEAPPPQSVFEDLIAIMHDPNSTKNRDIVTRVRPTREG